MVGAMARRETFFRSGCRRWFAALSMALPLSAAVIDTDSIAAETQLVGHRAIYTVTLVETGSGSGVVDADGAVLYRFTDVCSGWTVENRTAIRLGTADGEEIRSDWSYASWESKDGRAFRFRVRDERDNEIVEELRGAAFTGVDGEGGTVKLSQPEGMSMKLPPGTLFPTTHLLKVLAQARAGSKTVSEIVFDGADLDNPYRVNAVIGPAPDAARRRLAEISGLPDLPVWSVRLAFFPVADKDAATPSFEVGVHYREDGIGNSILQDFGDIVLRLELKDVEVFPPPDC